MWNEYLPALKNNRTKKQQFWGNKGQKRNSEDEEAAGCSDQTGQEEERKEKLGVKWREKVLVQDKPDSSKTSILHIYSKNLKCVKLFNTSLIYASLIFLNATCAF